MVPWPGQARSSSRRWAFAKSRCFPAPATPKSCARIAGVGGGSGKSESLNVQVRDLLSHEAFRVYTSTDPWALSPPAP